MQLCFNSQRKIQKDQVCSKGMIFSWLFPNLNLYYEEEHESSQNNTPDFFIPFSIAVKLHFMIS